MKLWENGYILQNLQCGAPKIANLVYVYNNYGLWSIYLHLLRFIDQLITRGPCIVAGINEGF